MGIRDVVLVRTRDEAERIGPFCTAYRGAWKILVADGGSLDNTKAIAASFPNVEVRDYPGREKKRRGYWRNNDSDHLNWLIDWAQEYHPDWIIQDDCDCRPNYLLREGYHKIMEDATEEVLMVTRIYFWGLDQHFPHLAKPAEGHKQWEPSLWAWRGGVPLKTVNVPPAYTLRIGEQDVADLHLSAKTLDLFPPLALLHYPWWPPSRMQEKLKTYRESGLIPDMLDPEVFGGPPAPIEWWMRE